MKIKSKIYSKILVDLIIEKKTPAEQKKVIDRFFKFLEKNGDLKKTREIISLSEILLFKKTGDRKITLETARPLVAVSNVKSSLKIKKGDFISNKINPDIIAGIKITVNSEKQLDFSLKSKLDRIFSA